MYTKLKSTKTFAYMDSYFIKLADGTQTDTVRTILTDDSYSPSDYSAIIDETNDRAVATGVTMVHNSKSAC